MFIFIALPASHSPLVRVKRMNEENGVSRVLDTAERIYCIVPHKKHLNTPHIFSCVTCDLALRCA